MNINLTNKLNKHSSSVNKYLTIIKILKKKKQSVLAAYRKLIMVEELVTPATDCSGEYRFEPNRTNTFKIGTRNYFSFEYK